MMNPLEVVILAAGAARRMLSDRPKIMHEVAGVPMLSLVLATARQLQPRGIRLVLAPNQQQAVPASLLHDDCQVVVQPSPRGTADALALALGTIEGNPDVLVLYGDMPLLRAPELQSMRAAAGATSCALAVLTARVADPTGYGRIIRDATGQLLSVVEEAEATHTQADIREINTGVCLATKLDFEDWLGHIKADNTQGELYLTEVVAKAHAAGREITGLGIADATDAMGVNNKAQLAAVEAEQQQRLAGQLLDAGVTLQAPDRLTLRGELRFGKDCQIDVGAVLAGPLHCGDRVQIGAYTVLQDCRLEDDVVIEPFCHIEGCTIAMRSKVGPFARVRSGTSLGAHTEIGNFVEVNRAVIGANTKVKHFSYLGDLRLGDGANVGAGAVVCNYDGKDKHQTYIGDGVFIGSNSTLVAPLEIKAGAYVAAGSTVTRNVGKDQLAIGRSQQKNVSAQNVGGNRADDGDDAAKRLAYNKK